MKKSFMRYGVYSGIFILALLAVNWIIISLGATNYAINEITGYASIIISLSFVYFGIRYYRDKQNSGTLTFGQGLKTGMLIVLVPSVCFGLTDVLYIQYINPGFYEKYMQKQEALMKASMTPAEFAAKAPGMRKEMLFFSQPWADFFLMFVTVAAIGLIVTVISTFILKRATTKTTAAYAQAETIVSTVN